MMLTGALDLQADLRTQGKLSELVQNLEGTVNTSVRDGRMEKFALVGNILSMQNVVDVMKGGPKLDQQGFPFRRLSAAGRFEKGRLVIDEGMFQSDAIGLAAQGSISLTDFDSRLTVLVAPLGLADEAVRKLPVLGYVLGGALTSLPVSVSGDIRDPRVVPLGPGAITNELLGIVKRTVTLPKKLVEPLRDGK
jgi:autotransporter translocation and assembly factor TamB